MFNRLRKTYFAVLMLFICGIESIDNLKGVRRGGTTPKSTEKGDRGLPRWKPGIHIIGTRGCKRGAYIDRSQHQYSNSIHQVLRSRDPEILVPSKVRLIEVIGNHCKTATLLCL